MRYKPLLVALAFAAAAAQAADAYRWTDADGTVHYSDTAPPPPVKSELVHLAGSVKPAAGGAAGAAANDADEPKSTPDKAKKDPVVRVTPEAIAEGRCAQAKSELSLLQSDSPVGLPTTGDAKPQPLDENARKEQIARVQSVIASDCK